MKSIIVIATILLSYSVSGCDCNTISGFKESAIVFTGVVLEVKQSSKPIYEYDITFQVLKMEKGKISAKQCTIHTPCLMEACCGIPFAVGEMYKVYSVEWKGDFYANICTETAKIE